MAISYTHTHTSNQEMPRFHVDKADDDLCIINVEELGKVLISLSEDEITVAIYQPHAIGGDLPVGEVSVKKSDLK